MADSELEQRIARVSVGLGRKRADVVAQVEGAEDPLEMLRSLERRYARLSIGIRKRAEDRELDGLAIANRARHDVLRESTDAELHGRRLRKTLGQRLDSALAVAETLTTVPASPIVAPTSGSKPGSKAPGKALNSLTVDDPDELTIASRFRVVIGQFVENLEREVDMSLRRPSGAGAESQTAEERDRRLVERWSGVNSSIVSALDPQLGSARTVENCRHRLGLRRVDGSAAVKR